MNWFNILVLCPILFINSSTTLTIRSRHASDRAMDNFGYKTSNAKTVGQIKRDTSLSYAATNIDSKEGTRVKTITVIKNHSGEKSEKLAIDPELHKNEEWANAFRDNFDSYGPIPDVPDIDDLFEFVKKKSKDKGDDSSKPTTAAPKPKNNHNKKDETKPVEEPSAEETTPEPAERPVQKIKGDAEIVPGLVRNQTSARSQSLGIDQSSVKREPLININFTTPQHSTHHYLEKYVQEIPSGYDYAKPCPQGGRNVVNIVQPSGRTYDIPVEEDTAVNPYIAPAISRKAQAPQQPSGVASAFAKPGYSVNSILPPLQPTQASNTGNAQPTQAPQQVGFSTSQRPYVAPSVRNNYGANIAPSLRPVYRNDVPNYNIGGFGFGANRAHAGRSRGLKY